MTYTVARIMKV